MAASALYALGRGDEIVRRFAAEPAAATVAKMLAQGIRSPLTSSAGRLIDAAAGLLDARRRASFEGQAAMLLEGLAERHGDAETLADGWRIDEHGVLDLLPTLDALTRIDDAGYGAALFHETFAAALAEWVRSAAARESIRTVVFGGGCFMNHVLATRLRSLLEQDGFSVFEARQVPPNDGGISLGQAAVARESVPLTRASAL
jgi:hydrogenase maturation protein HypF